MGFKAVKAFLEETEVPMSTDVPPANLASCVIGYHTDTWLASGDVTTLWSPLSWRVRLQEMEEKAGIADKKGGSPQGGKGPANALSLVPRNEDEEDQDGYDMPPKSARGKRPPLDDEDGGGKKDKK